MEKQQEENWLLKYFKLGHALFLLFALLLSFSVRANNSIFTEPNPPWYIHFNEDTGSHTSGTSSSFISTLASGNSMVTTGNGGSYTLQNPGTPGLGVGSELMGKASSNGIPAKFSISDYSPGKSFYLKFSVMWNGATSGEWYCAVGNGDSYTNGEAFIDNEVFAAFRLTYTTGNNLTIGVRNGTSWTSLPGLTVGIKQNTTYVIEIFGNNSTSGLSYTYGSNLTNCGTETIPSARMDVFVNGLKVGNDLAKGEIPTNTNIDSYMFYSINSPQNLATYYLDDIIYSNNIPTVPVEPSYQPSSLAFSDTTSTSYKVNFSAAHGNPAGYIVLRRAGSDPESLPEDFKNYVAGMQLGDAYVAYIGSNVSFSESNLNSDTHYFYKIYSYNGSGSCRNYSTLLPLNGSVRTFLKEDIAAFRSKRTGKWNTSTSWDYEYLPGKFKSSSITPTKANKSITILKNHIITTSAIETKNLILEEKATLVIDGDLKIEKGLNEGVIAITGELEATGQLENKINSKVEFSGTGNQTIPSGSYYNLSVKTGGIKTLSGDVMVIGKIELNNASINTLNHILTLDSAASLEGESDTNYIKGKVKVVKSLSGKIETFNGIGLKIDGTQNNENLGKVTIIRSTGNPTFIGPSSSISRNWSIEPQNQPKKAVNVTFEWLASDEHIPFDLKYMQVWKSTNKGITWFEVGEYQNAINRFITVSTSSFSDWTVSDFNNILPISIESFTGKVGADGLPLLTWKINSALMNSHFDVEKSVDGTNFRRIAQLKYSETPSVKNLFQFTDQHFPYPAYYRLKCSSEAESVYSDVLFINKSPILYSEINFFPNPFNSLSQPKITIPDSEGELQVIVYSTKGKEVFRKKGSLSSVNKSLSETLKYWEEGFFIFEVKSKSYSQRLKVFKEK